MSEQDIKESETNLVQGIQRLKQSIIRRRWWVLSATFLVAIAAMGILAYMPDVYTSEATLAIVRQRIPERYVAPLNVESVAEELNAVKVAVLSQKRVLEIVEALNLYPKLRQKLAPDEIADVMRRDVTIESMGGTYRTEADSFRVTYTTNNPQLAQSVTNWLTTLFIEENLRTRGNQADVTAKFLNERLEAAKQRLAEQEEQLRKYKMSNLGALPEQQPINLAALADLRTRLQDVTTALSRARQQRLFWESMLRGRIAALQSERLALLSRITPQHPEVIKKDKQIAAVEEFSAQLKSEKAPPDGFQRTLATEDMVLAQLQGQAESNFNEVEELIRTEKTLRSQMAQYQTRLNTVPIKEQELATIQRNYETYRKDYQEILDKQLNSQLSVSLKESEEGRHYRLVDPPSLPSRPSSPKRFRMSLTAIGGGLALGLILALLRDYLEGVFRTEDDLRQRFDVPLIISLPVFSTPAEEKRKKANHVLEWAAGVTLLFLLGTAEIFLIKR